MSRSKRAARCELLINDNSLMKYNPYFFMEPLWVGTRNPKSAKSEKSEVVFQVSGAGSALVIRNPNLGALSEVTGPLIPFQEDRYPLISSCVIVPPRDRIIRTSFGAEARNRRPRKERRERKRKAMSHMRWLIYERGALPRPLNPSFRLAPPQKSSP